MSDSQKEVPVEQNNQSGDNNQQNQGNDNDKISRAYEANLKKLARIVGGEKNVKPVRTVGGDTLGALVKDLLKERREATQKEVKEGLLVILDKKAALDKEIKQKQDELNKLVVQKKKEFNEAFSKIVSKIENVDKLEENYLETLGEPMKNQEPPVKE